MNRRADRPQQPILLALAGAGTLVVWIWDISWVATLGPSDFPGLPRWLAVGGCLVWALLFFPSSTDWRAGRGLGAGGAVLAGVSLLVAIVPSSASSAETGYLNGGGLLLTVGVGLLSLATLGKLLRSPAGSHSTFWLARAFAGALLLLWLATLFLEYVGWPNLWRGPEFSMVAGGVFLLPLSLLASATPFRVSATVAALLYWVLGGMVLVALYVLPVRWFSQDPSLSHFVLLPAPLLLFLPGLGVDGVSQLRLPGSGWVVGAFRGILMAGLFVGLLWVVHWNLAELFVDPDGPGRFLAARWWPEASNGMEGAFEYWTLAPGPRRWALEMAGAIVTGSISAWVGLWLGKRCRGNAEPTRRMSDDL